MEIQESGILEIWKLGTQRNFQTENHQNENPLCSKRWQGPDQKQTQLLIFFQAVSNILHCCSLSSMQSLTSLARCLMLRWHPSWHQRVSKMPSTNRSKGTLQRLWSLGALGDGSGWYLRVCPVPSGNLERRKQGNKQSIQQEHPSCLKVGKVLVSREKPHRHLLGLCSILWIYMFLYGPENM